jgi:hypothetical protein
MPMTPMNDLLDEVDRLPNVEKWVLVKHVLQTLEHEQEPHRPQNDWHTRLRAMYGALADDPIERPEQLPLEEREPITT